MGPPGRGPALAAAHRLHRLREQLRPPPPQL